MFFAFRFFTIAMASMHKGAVKVISRAAGGDLPVNSLILVMTAVLILYCLVGGVVTSLWIRFFARLPCRTDEVRHPLGDHYRARHAGLAFVRYRKIVML